MVLAELWLHVDLRLPYAAGELLARARERGTVSFEYGDEDVRVSGRVPPSLAGELRNKAATWERAREAGGGGTSADADTMGEAEDSAGADIVADAEISAGADIVADPGAERPRSTRALGIWPPR